MHHLVIIGNGIAGVTCARHVRKRSNCRITLISSESRHFFSRTALMYVYMGHLKYEHTKPYEDGFWAKNRLELVQKHVAQVVTARQELVFSDGSTLTYDRLVIASGSRPNAFGWPGHDLPGVQGLYSLQDLQRLEARTPQIKRAVVVGGGLIGIELAEMLHSRRIPVTFLVRERHFWGSVLPAEEAQLIGRHIREHHVDLRLQTELAQIKGDATHGVQAVVTKDGQEIPCQFVGVTAGVRPNIDWLAGSGIETGRGVLVDECFETNVPGVYAIGDCAQYRTPPPGRKPVEQVWYTGRMHGETLARTLTGKRTPYAPGHWFNSAKFLDIEYQTYGQVGNTLGENEATFYWEHADGRKSLRVNYHPHNRQVLGFNAFGIRLRHEVCDRWLTEKRPVEYVMSHLREANFDPEFYRRHEKEIADAFLRHGEREQQTDAALAPAAG